MKWKEVLQQSIIILNNLGILNAICLMRSSGPQEMSLNYNTRFKVRDLHSCLCIICLQTHSFLCLYYFRNQKKSLSISVKVKMVAIRAIQILLKDKILEVQTTTCFRLNESFPTGLQCLHYPCVLWELE